MNIEDEIATLHAQYQLFSSVDLENESSENILNELQNYPDFEYLVSFYKTYAQYFGEEKNVHDRTKYSKSRDLPFIGKSVIEKQKVKFIFYFEGSLSEKDKLSITVLVHLWIINDEEIISLFYKKWWRKSNYDFVKKQLDLSLEVLQNSYITDSVRFSIENEDKSSKSNDNKNSKLIFEEIKMLKPQLVICVGTKARELVGMQYYEQNTKFHYVPFPSLRFSNKVETRKNTYKELNNILTKILNKLE